MVLTNWKGSASNPTWIETDWPKDVVRALFTFREGGVSRAPFDTMNIGYHVPDEPDLVRRNREICATWMGGTLTDWVVPEQVHGTGVAVVGLQDEGRGSIPEKPPVAGVDALVTNQAGVTLVVLSADCVPLLFLDRRRRVIGAAHSGWKGTVGHIARRVVETMQREFDVVPRDIEVWMGPSVRRCCYEVDERVANPVMEEFGAGPLIRRHGQPGKYWLSLQACIRQDLQRSGMEPLHIHDGGVCSSCRTDVLFSHRAENGKTGRFMGAIRLVGDKS